MIALVGRPNVGKSTLFNRLTRSRDAIVARSARRHARPPLRRGPPRRARPSSSSTPAASSRRRRGHLRRDGAPGASRRSPRPTRSCSWSTAARASRPRDRAIAEKLRKRRQRRCTSRSTRPRACKPDIAVAEFHELGLGDAGGDLGGARRGRARADRGRCSQTFPSDDEREEDTTTAIRASRSSAGPNVGKSTLVNALVGEERVIAFDQPGTTRDPIEVPFERGGAPLHADRHRRRAPARQAPATPVENSSRSSRRCRRSRRANVAVLRARRASRASPSRTRTSPATSSSAAARVVLAVNKWDAADRGGARAHQGRGGVEARLPRLRRVAA